MEIGAGQQVRGTTKYHNIGKHMINGTWVAPSLHQVMSLSLRCCKPTGGMLYEAMRSPCQTIGPTSQGSSGTLSTCHESVPDYQK